MKKNKKLNNQKRASKRSEKSRKRRKKYERIKNIKASKTPKPIIKTEKVNNVSIFGRIKSFFFNLVMRIKRALCYVGFHDWKLCAGLEGDSMYTCIKCWKGSKIKWTEGGSEKYYLDKKNYNTDVAKKENWKRKKDGYYFKGDYVNLSPEEIKRLKKILAQKTLKIK